MTAFMEELQHLKIQLEAIKSATNNFDDTNVIGNGGFGKVYKGEISHFKGRGMVAFKRLDRKFGQGRPEFFKEIAMLSHYTHENLISLLGFCNQGDEMILLYEYASRGSLDRHLKDVTLTWTQRLRICIDAAKGLSYLHDPNGTHQRVLHCDIKSANILLADDLNAKVSDFGLSKLGPANQQCSVLVTNAGGTFGYCDPLYMETYSLTKESDVYSFGVVLFEVLCGRLCVEYTNDHFKVLVPHWKKSYEENRLDEVIFKNIKNQIDLTSLEIFSDIAYQCLQKSCEERPTMSLVLEKLEAALQIQVYHDVKLPKEYIEVLRAVVPPLKYRSVEELNALLSKGVLLNGGKTWFSLNAKGEHCEMISIAACLIQIEDQNSSSRFSSYYNSRFPVGCYKPHGRKLKTRVRTQFLSPGITYAVNFVFKFVIKKESRDLHIGLQYKLEGETKTSIVYLAQEREDDWFMAELYQFTSDHKIFDLEIIFEDYHSYIVIDGIELKPVEKAELDFLEVEKVDMQPISDLDTYWEQIAPNEYEDIINWSKGSVQWTSKKELYSILCTGFLLNNGREWFFIDKNGKKCHMLSARASNVHCGWSKWRTSPESRFGEVIALNSDEFKITSEIKSQLVSPQTAYASYLVYKLPESSSTFWAPLKVKNTNDDLYKHWYIYLVRPPPHTTVIGQKFDLSTHSPSNRPNTKGLPQQRSDGWMEVQVWEFETSATNAMISMCLQLKHPYNMYLRGLIIQGIELRPLINSSM